MATKTTANTEKFVFKSKATGATLELPDISKKATAGFLRRNRKAQASEMMWMLMEEYLSEEELSEVDALPMNEFTELQEKWAAFMGIGSGESHA